MARVNNDWYIHMFVLPRLAWHVSHLLSFQHDGRGLPRLNSPVLLVLVGLRLVFACLVILILMPGASVFFGFLKALLAVAALYGCAHLLRRPYAFSGYLLSWLGVDVGLLVMNVVVDHIPMPFITTCYVWGLLAFIVLLVRAANKHEQEKSS
ncbi:hypothetical protein KTD31_01665 [Burkholderia multivorans]|jgi:accessory gene regulator protein AgrB|uniref:hypothetical protein n=1 Tax=Burkholderia multivorans TaxID=87883 RepID=UPI001C23C393|nr:hypothetical protein [Burkholderia multivorans]MBU9200110.1 hypothetical protein [Burkholderia multivorans]MDN8078768.1 hypothetical protein [Burkholderia multivorans]